MFAISPFISTIKLGVSIVIVLFEVIVSPVRSTYGGYYGLVVVTPCPRPQTLHRLRDNFKNPNRIASIFYM